jgi:hypothetical protein
MEANLASGSYFDHCTIPGITVCHFHQVLQKSDIMNTDGLKEYHLPCLPSLYLRTAWISASTHLPMPMRNPTYLWAPAHGALGREDISFMKMKGPSSPL